MADLPHRKYRGPHFLLSSGRLESKLNSNRTSWHFIANRGGLAYFMKNRTAEDTQESLEDLYQEFKKHNIYEIVNNQTLDRIKPESKQWEVPEDAKQFIIERAER